MAQEPPPHLWRFQGFRPCLTTRTEGRKALLKTLRRQRSAPLARLPGFRKLPLHRSSTAPCVAGRSGKLATGGCIPVFGNCSASKPPHNTSVEPTSRDNAALVGSLFALDSFVRSIFCRTHSAPPSRASFSRCATVTRRDRVTVSSPCFTGLRP